MKKREWRAEVVVICAEGRSSSSREQDSELSNAAEVVLALSFDVIVEMR